MRSGFIACALAAIIQFSAFGQARVPAGAAFKAGAMSDTESVAMWEILKSKGYLSPEELRIKVRAKLLVENRLPYRYQRVEVSGVGAIDDTNATWPNMIDFPLKTSNYNELFPEEQRIADFASLRKHATDAINGVNTFFGRDLRESFSDTRGVPSPRSQQVIAQLKDATINELFAHSWGTEVVYLGILNGDIIPPKRLVVVGVPESNEEKWRMLAAYTGIEVHVVGFEWDKARIAGEVAMKFKSGLPRDTASLQKLWNEKCRARMGKAPCSDPEKFVQKNFDYNLHVSPPEGPKDTFVNETIRQVLDHDRLLYYDYLSKRNLFNKTVEQLEAPQLKLIEAEESEILAEALNEARALIARARAQAAIAQRDHDERLKRTYAEMAIRSCANPGSVSQDELDDLPVPFQKDLQWSGDLPPGLDECAVQVYFILRKGLDANRLRERSMPVVPFAVLPDAPRVAAARPSPPATPAAQPKIPLNSIFPTLKDVAVRACASPARAVFGVSVPQSASAYSFNRDRDDESAALFSDGLGECARGLFYKLIDTIRSGQVSVFNDAWLREMAKRSSAAGYVAPSPQSSLPVGCIPGDSSRRNCIACGNTNCG